MWSSNHGIVYFNHGTKHLVRLVVSLHSLRKFYHGPVYILETGDPSASLIISEIAREARLDVSILTVPLIQHRRHSCYVTKSTLWRHSPFATTLLVDADTLFAKNPEELFGLVEHPNSGGIVVTQFSSWTTHKRVMRRRLARWAEVEHREVAELLRRSLEEPKAAINTGVVVWKHDADILGDWEAMTRAGWRTPFTDEVALQLLILKYKHVLASDRWNCSPLYGREKDAAVIWHFHGNKQCRPEAAHLWMPAYRCCVDSRVARIHEWTPAGDGRLARHLAEFGNMALP